MVWSQSAIVSESIGGRRLIPAELTRMSGSPNSPATASAARASAAAVAQVGAHPDGRPARRPQLAHGLVQPALPAGHHHDPCPRMRQRPGHGPADAGAAAGDHRDQPVQ